MLLKKSEGFPFKVVLLMSFAALLLLITPDFALAASTSQVQSKLNQGAKAIQLVLTSLVVVMGIIAAIKIVVKHLPSIDDAHVKNEMWKGIGQVFAGVIAGAALVWIIPWAYSLFV
ncbi:CagC family type IV secretion system protein [Pontibacillus litoralis]|uniref:Conjugal transfer protein n=1 Tax=Pontibacillus litoralis JSM 072002 TaxID=1385512 RepID=A0A0A5FZF9_9BACI|nr:CagC family type IV secretion system protein [Pontibacillus litoralis]KGX85184.1 hypothetical protein N784_09820 [Pontibacillus litoralis JSM 072002]